MLKGLMAVDPHGWDFAAEARWLALTTAAERAAGREARAREAPQRPAAFGVISMYGVIEPRPSIMGRELGRTSYEAIGRTFDMLLSDESIKAIILDVNSPGGWVSGCQELAAKIAAGRGVKPIVAIANPMAASAAYWICAAASRVYCMPSGDVGSVGCIKSAFDYSAMNERIGVKAELFRAADSPLKGEENDVEPLTEEARGYIQKRIDEMGRTFVADLARLRGVPEETVRAKFGKGRVVGAKEALAAGMIDGLDTLDGVLAKLADGRIRIRLSADQQAFRAAATERAAQLAQRAGGVR